MTTAARKPRPGRGGQGLPMDDAEVARAVELHRRGLKLYLIARTLSRGEDTVRRCLARECGRPTRPTRARGSWEDYPPDPDPDREARILAYRARAELDLPLFDGPRPDGPTRSRRAGWRKQPLRCFLRSGSAADSRWADGENL